jgi:exopolysaccharide biosynthesis polyprenyl glycosylphosphotransferase
MPYFRRQILLIFFQLSDLLLTVACFLLGTMAVSHGIDQISFESFLGMRIKVQNFVILLAFIFMWHGVFALFGLYNSKRLSTRWEEVLDILKATSVGTLIIALAGVLFKISLLTPIFLGVFYPSVNILTILGRLLGRFALQRLRIRGRNLRYMLIVGTNSRSLRFAHKIVANPQLGYKIIGFVDDEWDGIGDFQKSGYSLIASLKNFPSFLRENVVDEVVISLPVKSSYEQISQLVNRCEKHGIVIRFLSDFFNQKLAGSKSEQFEGVSVVTLSTGALTGWPVLIKRALDFCLSLILIILTSPLFLIAGLGIKLTSPGPIFFIQERLGLNKRIFRLYKFRTMVINAEKMIAQLEHLNEVDGPAFKIKNDPRITPFGRFLRKTSIDELPQFINVLRGNMSLVGPRPLPVRDYNGFSHDWQRRRFSVRPGITCLWQINGRSNIPFENWMKLDIEYIDNWSLSLDLKILWKTIPKVLKGDGAS